MSKRQESHQLKTLARACQFCRVRKIKCDTQRPSCGSCVSQKRHCVYVLEPPKRRPSTALVNTLKSEKQAIEEVLIRLKLASSEDRDKILDSVPIIDGSVRPTCIPSPEAGSQSTTRSCQQTGNRYLADDDDGVNSSDEDLDVLPFLSIDERGKVDSFGPSSALQGPTKPLRNPEYPVAEHVRNQLVANAVLQRQREYDLHSWQEIDGVPADLALHLLDLHWNRQHHTFLLTYRPTMMRDLMQDGPYCSKFLLNAIFASSSKYSQRIEVRDDPADPGSSGKRFFIRCDQLLAQQSLLNCSSIPTLVGLLLLGSTYNARGETSKGWLYTGYALRMVYDLGLHLDSKETTANAEELEIRRRVFWGAFICDKLQSLYLGRPMAIHLRDAHVSRNFMDTMEEKELWTPYIDSKSIGEPAPMLPMTPTPIYSVSTFQQLCLLSRIMTRIINRFYVVGATAENARTSLESINDALTAWKENLPPALTFEPWSSIQAVSQYRPPPNIMILNAVYYSLVILLHRPFISDGHLRTAVAPASSWKLCSSAATNITSIVLSYQSAYTLRAAPYLLSYSVYVACTIHVRNAAATECLQRGENSSQLAASLKCLDELTMPNSGVSKPASIIRKLMVANGLELSSEPPADIQSPSSLDLDAILRMFPSRSPATMQLTQTESFDDLLYGFMNEEIVAFPDLTNNMLLES
ncbi:hypothetical protein AJ79_00790 [Helicocarpus griseus UAMH5409]|uniref:Zn(2)-C6 fungal-type domain-containing protein n=1 Tax=Helicocarpus griseus UAMH5409 TaxID=1447875 RepID=A0A2B7YA06_9EURO|nr:hypothetical protein AJ79_00790 [Helicocarpus griseus UAMH5409]